MSEREQCWVIHNEVVDPQPKIALTQQELTERHHRFIMTSMQKVCWSGRAPSLTTPAIASAPG